MVRGAFTSGTWYEAGGKVPAHLLRELLVGPSTPASALRIRNARIDGELSLAFLETRVPILLERCELTEPPVLYWSRLGYLSLQESRMPGIVASDVRLDGHLRLTRAVVDGEVRLRGAEITGGLLLDGARLTNAGGHAVQGERLHVSGDLIADRASVVGELMLLHAEIDGRLDLDNSRLAAPGGVALSATGVRLGGGAFARRAIVDGEASFRDAAIAGAVVLSGARLSNPDGVALRLSRATTGGVFMGGGFRARGEVRMHGARIGHGLSLQGATLDNPAGVALDADRVRIDGDLEAEGLVAEGTVRLRDATVSNTLRLDGAAIGVRTGAVAAAAGIAVLDANGLQAARAVTCTDGFTCGGPMNFTGAQAGMLTFRGARLGADTASLIGFRLEARELDLRFADPPGGQVNLAHAEIGIVHDAPESWPRWLVLDGATYQTLRPALRPERRLAWLARGGPEYLPQPYEQLARLYRGYGDDKSARTVHLAQYRHLRGTMSWPGRLWGWLQDVVVGYGYQPARAALWLVAMLVVGTVFFGVDRPHPVGTGAPAFNPFLYALDVLIPIIDLGQQSAYGPTGIGAQTVSDLLILSGWILATTAAAGATRALRRD
jgi:adhesin HecA-like repeat protein